MSLQVWLPLNGSLKNKGIGTLSSEFSISSPIYSAGKTGNNLKISNQQSNIVTINELTNKKNVTISFWFCPNSGNTFGQWRDVISFGVSNGTTVSSFRMEASSSTGKNFGWWGNGILTTDWGCCPYTLNLDTWYHITIVLNGTTIKKYINGGLKETFTIPTSYANNYYFTGTMTLGDASMYVSLADVRIYDECLSVKQIKEISKGLVLHYPLNSGYGNENLLVNSYNGCNVSYSSGTILDETYCGFKIRYLKYEGTSYQDTVQVLNVVAPKPDSYYTISFWAKGNCGISNFFFPSNCASGISSDGHTTTSVDGNCYISLTPEWKRYWITWKTRSDVSGAKNIVVGRIQNQGTGAECYIAGLKFEEGDKNSVWSPNKADDLYSILGYDSTTMYDTSGFGNNAEKINTPIYTSDTALYDSCINFNQSGYLKNTSLDLYANKLTICFWVKMPNTIITQHFLFSTHNDWTYNGVGMWRDNSTEKGYYLLIKSNTETTFSRPFIGINADTWTFISISYTGKQYSVYKNGSLYQTVDYGNDGQVYNPVLYLGNSLYNGTPSTETDEALMSDFRIYATALTADDIEQLYQSKARIDKNGNVYCNQFIDNDYEEELLTTQKMTFHQANSQGTITYETNGNEVINIITMDNTISSWKYLFNNAFDKTKIINHKLKLSFKYKTNVSTAYSMAVKMCKGDSTKPQTINIGSITLSTNWQEYNGIITFGNTYDNQGIYIHTGNFCGGNLYIKDLSLKIYKNNNKTDFTKKSQIITGELSELDSNKTYVYKNSKIVTNQIIEN